MTTEQLKLQVEEARNKANIDLADKIETAKLKAELSMLTNDKLLEAQAMQAIRKSATEKLEELDMVCAQIVEDNPVRNNVTRQDRVWNPSRQYGLGNQLAILTGLLSGIQYSVREHTDLMFAVTNLDKDLIESTLEAFGNLPYYSANYQLIVEGTHADLSTLQSNLAMIEQSLGIQLDKSKLTQSNLDTRYEVAKTKAERAEAEAALVQATEQYVIS